MRDLFSKEIQWKAQKISSIRYLFSGVLGEDTYQVDRVVISKQVDYCRYFINGIEGKDKRLAESIYYYLVSRFEV